MKWLMYCIDINIRFTKLLTCYIISSTKLHCLSIIQFILSIFFHKILKTITYVELLKELKKLY